MTHANPVEHEESATKHLYDYVDPKVPEKVLGEILHIAGEMSLQDVGDAVTRVHADIVRLFNGKYPGYRRSTAKYHNLEHTCSVALATARLLHGCVLEGCLTVSGNDLLLSLLAAYFHDTGMIQEEGDTEGTGAKYTIGHEQRSVVVLEGYMRERNFDDSDIAACADMINCTILNLSPDDIRFVSPQVGVLGRIVGTADLVAQLADRTYLEKLRLLFLEFEEANLPGFSSELELIMKTEAFYTNVAKRRLDAGLGHLYVHMRRHFRERYGLDEDLYAKAIEGNIEYISRLAARCKQSPECYEELLRRGLEV